MSWKRTIMAGVAFLLCLLVFYADHIRMQRRVFETINETSLSPGINLSDVTEIRLQNDEGEVLLERQRDGWRIRTPFTAVADQEMVEQLLINVTSARKRNEIEARNLAEYGLAAPEIILTLRTSQGKTFEVMFGNTSTYTGQVFAALPDSKTVFTVGEHVRNSLRRAPADFRYARLLDVASGDLDAYKELSIVRDGAAAVLRQDAGQWRIVQPVESPAEKAVVEDYLRKLGLLRASGFIAEQTTTPVTLTSALQALTSPSVVITLTGPGNPIGLAVANAGTTTAPVFVAQRLSGGEVLLLRRETLDAVAEDENFFRSRTIFSMAPADVGLFSIEIGRGRTDLVRGENGRWEFVGDPSRRVDQEQVNVRLDTLLRSRLKEYVDANPRDAAVYELAPIPRFRFTVQSKDKSRTEVLECGRSEPGRAASVYARRGGDPSVFTMDLSRDLIISPDIVADRRFLRFDPRQAAAAEIRIADAVHKLQREGGVWKLLKHGQTVPAPADGPRADRVLALMSALEYSRDFAADGEAVIAPSDGPVFSVSVTDADGARLAAFEVTKRLPKDSFVKTPDGRTFEVPNRSLDAIEAAARSLIQ